jgi:phosphate transport system substrate-binding protein
MIGMVAKYINKPGGEHMYRKTKSRLFVLPLVVVVLASLVLSGCPSQSGTVYVGGSTTVQPLAEKWGTAFEAENPDINIVVEGGGSSAGVRGCGEGTFDIGTASRELKGEELGNYPELKVFRVALDGVAIIVHPSNNITELTLEEVKDIFAAGSNDIWTVINRDEGSGTRDVFEEKVMEGTLLSLNAEFLTSNGAVKQKVAITENAIGYISLGYVDSSVKALTIGGIVCDEANCIGGIYPITRYLNFVTRGNPGGKVKDFIDFCMSDEGQQVVREEGYISLY